ncbi:MAG TPA: iron-containing alcohol dehydrogenase [Myxococcales bacterium]|nr:iron-containing alcohol dehydrogenase [Myxococcales bacterium]
MPSFRYSNPSAIHWGEGCIREGLLEALGGAKRVLLVTTKSAVANARLSPFVESLLGDRLIGRAVIGQHAPAADVMAAVSQARDADLLVSLGGGSPIDAAKAVAFSHATGLDLREPDAPQKSRAMKLPKVLPHIALPTTLSVAELGPSAGYSAEGTREKVGVNAPQLLPAAVFYDASLAVLTPLPLWLSTGVRAVDHAVETLIADGEHPLPDTAAVDALRRLKQALPAAKDRPDDAEARTAGQLGAWFSYLLPSKAATGLSHRLGKQLGSKYGIPHGVTSCLLLPHVLRVLAPRHPEAAKRIAEALDAPDAASGVAALIERLGVPRHLSQWKLTDEQLRQAALPLVSAEHPEAELVGMLRAAL